MAFSPSRIARPPRRVVVTGASGYLGRALLLALLERGHRVRALVRPTTSTILPKKVEVSVGNPLLARDIALTIGGADTVVHLVGVAKPNPAKARQFRDRSHFDSGDGDGDRGD